MDVQSQGLEITKPRASEMAMFWGHDYLEMLCALAFVKAALFVGFVCVCGGEEKGAAVHAVNATRCLAWQEKRCLAAVNIHRHGYCKQGRLWMPQPQTYHSHSYNHNNHISIIITSTTTAIIIMKARDQPTKRHRTEPLSKSLIHLPVTMPHVAFAALC